MSHITLNSPTAQKAFTYIFGYAHSAYLAGENAISKWAKLYPSGYMCMMNTILRTDVFDAWLSKLKDPRAKARIIKRVRSAERGNLGDCKPVGAGVSEMRIHFGPGYRVYFMRTGDMVYLLLCGGTKRGQSSDIAKAKELARLFKET
jgi:putative addiction module killer protein